MFPSTAANNDRTSNSHHAPAAESQSEGMVARPVYHAGPRAPKEATLASTARNPHQTPLSLSWNSPGDWENRTSRDEGALAAAEYAGRGRQQEKNRGDLHVEDEVRTEEGSPPHKRAKVTGRKHSRVLNCDNCRLKKMRCDRRDPCSNCSLRHIDCNWEGGRPSTPEDTGTNVGDSLQQNLLEITRLRHQVNIFAARLDLTADDLEAMSRKADYLVQIESHGSVTSEDSLSDNGDTNLTDEFVERQRQEELGSMPPPPLPSFSRSVAAPVPSSLKKVTQKAKLPRRYKESGSANGGGLARQRFGGVKEPHPAHSATYAPSPPLPPLSRRSSRPDFPSVLSSPILDSNDMRFRRGCDATVSSVNGIDTASSSATYYQQIQSYYAHSSLQPHPLHLSPSTPSPSSEIGRYSYPPAASTSAFAPPPSPRSLREGKIYRPFNNLHTSPEEECEVGGPPITLTQPSPPTSAVRSRARSEPIEASAEQVNLPPLKLGLEKQKSAEKLPSIGNWYRAPEVEAVGDKEVLLG